MFRTDTRHALRALTVLADSDAPLPIAVLAERTQAPAPMLAKVLHRLGQLGLVTGRTGPGGGYQLARPASEIRLAELVHAFERSTFARECLFGLPACSDQHPCPLHDAWVQLRAGLLDLVEQRSVADLVRPPEPEQWP